MSNFSFNSLAETSFVSESKKHLKPYEIYKVKLSKIERGNLQGKKDPSSKFDIVTLEFTSDDGIFSENIFVPNKDADFERRENPTTHNLMTSSFDRFQFTLMQIVEAINPKGAQTIKDNASKLKTIDDFINLIIKALNGKSDVEVYLKLVGQDSNGTTYARLPSSCLMGKDGKPYAVNFISPKEDKLFFTNYEIGQAKKYKEAKPTPMPDTTSDIGSELDLSDIEL